ncbi:MAG: putative toxin-antitoxin system toxin component, PIN family [Cytophagales bacterium]
MTRVIVDTGVVISAALKQDGTSRRALLSAGRNGVFLKSFQTNAELIEVINRPKFRAISSDIKAQILDILDLNSETIFTVSDILICRDPKDDMFLNLAIDGKADVIISRDPDLLVLHPFQGISILNPADFLAWMENKAV